MLALVGLGNPFPSYKNNRHNVGFTFIDYLANKKKAGTYKKKFNALIINTKINSIPILFIKPQTYMNKSGISIAKIMHFYKLDSKSFIIFHDDLDLNLGKIKTKIGGSDGGHNGLKSIDESIGDNYRRIRIGIGHPGKKELVNKYVLGDFKNNEYIALMSLIENFSNQFDNLIDILNENLTNDVSLIIRRSITE